jgi:hypothetical protein
MDARPPNRDELSNDLELAMERGQELELVNQLQGVIRRNLTGFRVVLTESADAAAQRYASMAGKKPSWSRSQLVKTLVARPANKAARSGAAAGGLAFIPGVFTGASAIAVATSSLKLLAHCVETSDLVASSHNFNLSEEHTRHAARLCVLHISTPKRARISLATEPSQSAARLLRLSPLGQQTLLDSSDDIVVRWGVAVATWRLSAVAPFGVGAFMGAWTSYAPVKRTIRSAEQFFAADLNLSEVLDEEEYLDSLLREEEQ